MPDMSEPYGEPYSRPYTEPERSGSKLWAVISFLLGMALLAAIIAIALAMGLLRLPGEGPIAGASPSPTSIAAASPTAEAVTPTPTAPPTPTAAPTDEPTPPAEPTPGGVHRVQSGESLSSIGILYGIPWQLIAEANNIEDPYPIFLGQELTIPVPDEPGQGATIHVVQSGESISSIALLHGVSPTDLADANDIENWDLIYVGQTLNIPGTGSSPEPAESPTPEPAESPTPEP